MKKLSVIVSACVIHALLAWPVSAQEITAKQMMIKCKEAARHLEEKGEAALPEFSDLASQWAVEPYIFVYDLEGTIIAHGSNPKLVGKNLIGLKDVKGNMFAAEFVQIAKEKGRGWSEYWWPKKDAKEASLKVSYILRVPGRNMFVGAGIYDITKAEAMAQAGE